MCLGPSLYLVETSPRTSMMDPQDRSLLAAQGRSLPPPQSQIASRTWVHSIEYRTPSVLMCGARHCSCSSDYRTTRKTSRAQAHKSIAHEGILKIYNGDDDNDGEGDVSLDELQVDMSDYSLDHYIPRIFDKLTLEELLLVFSYYQRQVKGAMNAKRRSGSHGSAATAAGNVHWLVYAVKLFESIGDKDFMSCVDPALSPEVMRSSAPSTVWSELKSRRNRRNCRSQTTEDYDDDNFLLTAALSTKAKKHSAMDAAEDTAIAIIERNDKLKRQ